MLATIIATAVFMGLVIAAMSIGVIFGRKPIAGSCGGVGNALNDPDYVCDICGNDPNKCEEQSGEEGKSKQASFYDAGSR